MRKAPTLVILGALLAVLSGSAHALGFGRIGGSTTLGQQLNFSALVRLEPDEQLGSECVSAEVFSGDNKLPAGAVRVSIEPAASASERLLRVTTLSLLDEPVVTVTLSAGCTSRLSRKFVVFLDPPVINLAQSAPAEAPPPPPAAVETPRGEAPVAAVPSAVQASRPAAPSQAIRPRPLRPKSLAVNPTANAAAAAAAARARRQKAAEQDIAANRLPSAGPRLKLEAPVVASGQRASAPSSTPLAGAGSAASAASAVSPAAAQAAASAVVEEQSQLIAKERERLKALEDSLNRLRAETEANQKTLMSLQSRLKGAESERFSNPLVYALGGLCAALVLAVAAMWRRHSLREAAWWAQPQPGATGETAPRQAPPVVSNIVPQVQAEEFFESESGSLHPVPAPVLAPAAAPKASAPATLPLPSHAAEPAGKTPRRELSVEELIDLEQQAEFFVVLGQDEAAIDLLMGHLRSTGGSSPLPYLKLLEIYRRQGDSEAYNRTRERFNRRFNAYAPDWDSDPQQGRSLQAYPEVIERLQAIWSKPTEVIELLDAALFRRDQSEDTFDVPAYRELVLLYSVIRDIAEHDDSGAVVDLLLPIDRSAEVAESHLTAPVPFVSVTELSAADRRLPTLDLDISAVRAFERPVDFETPDLAIGSRFLGLVDDPAAPGETPRKR